MWTGSGSGRAWPLGDDMTQSLKPTQSQVTCFILYISRSTVGTRLLSVAPFASLPRNPGLPATNSLSVGPESVATGQWPVRGVACPQMARRTDGSTTGNRLPWAAPLTSHYIMSSKAHHYNYIYKKWRNRSVVHSPRRRRVEVLDGGEYGRGGRRAFVGRPASVGRRRLVAVAAGDEDACSEGGSGGAGATVAQSGHVLPAASGRVVLLDGREQPAGSGTGTGEVIRTWRIGNTRGGTLYGRDA